jgi:hypothetical protein
MLWPHTKTLDVSDIHRKSKIHSSLPLLRFAKQTAGATKKESQIVYICPGQVLRFAYDLPLPPFFPSWLGHAETGKSPKISC